MMLVQAELPSDWVLASIESLMTRIKAGGTPKRGVPEYWEGTIPFVKIEDVTRSGGFVDTTNGYISEAGIANSSAWVVPVGSILLTMYGTIGVPALIARPAATNQAIIALLPGDRIDRSYLYFALKRWGTELERLNIQSTQKNINAGIVRSFEIPVPPLPEQRAIAEVLRTVQRAKETTEQVITAVRELKKSLLATAIGEAGRDDGGAESATSFGSLFQVKHGTHSKACTSARTRRRTSS